MMTTTNTFTLGLVLIFLGTSHANMRASAPASGAPVNDRVFSDVRLLRGALQTAKEHNAGFFLTNDAPSLLSYCVGFAGQLGALDQGRRMIRRFAVPLRESSRTENAPFRASVVALDQAYAAAAAVFSEYCSGDSWHRHASALAARQETAGAISRLNRIYTDAIDALTFAPLVIGEVNAEFYDRFVVSLTDTRNFLQEGVGDLDRCFAVAKTVGATDALLAALPPPSRDESINPFSGILAWRAMYFGIPYAEDSPLVARIAGILAISAISSAPEWSGIMPWIPNSNCTRTADSYDEDDVTSAWNHIRTQLDRVESGR